MHAQTPEKQKSAHTRGGLNGGERMRKFLIRLLGVIIVMGLLGFVAFAYIGDLSPQRAEVTVPVTIDLE